MSILSPDQIISSSCSSYLQDPQILSNQTTETTVNVQSHQVQKNNSRPKNLRLFTGMKPHQQQVAQKLRTLVDEDYLKNESFSHKGINAPPLLMQKKMNVRFNQSDFDSVKQDSLNNNNNIASSASTEDTCQLTPVISDDIGECCLADEINQIDENDALEQKIHKFLDEESVYITDPREKRDYYYQKLKSLSCKISQLQRQMQDNEDYQKEEEKSCNGSSDTIASSIILTQLTSHSLSSNTINDLPVHLNLKIENSPLLLRRNSNTHKKNHHHKTQTNVIQHTAISTLSQISSPLLGKPHKKLSIFKSTNDSFKLTQPSLDIKTIPFSVESVEELDQSEKKDSLKLQEMSSVSIDIQDNNSMICDYNQNEEL